MARLFGTDGIRAIANQPPLDPETLVHIGRCLVWRQVEAGFEGRVLIGRDTRVSGPMLEAALVAGICSAGGQPVLAGVLPTPAVARLAANRLHCAAVVVSASHNPWQYNGVKMIGVNGFKWSEVDEVEFERRVESQHRRASSEGRTSSAVGTPHVLSDAGQWYVDSLVETLAAEGSLTGLRLVIDCANGAAVPVAERLFARCGAAVEMLAVTPDGLNINAECGALYPHHVRERVLALGAHAGIAFDGDADRVILVDERGYVLDGDTVLWILARALVEAGKLSRPLVVGTIMSNLGLEQALNGIGVRLVRAPVGDRHVVDMMRREGAPLGGEPSGHVVWLEHTTTGDGLLTALAVLQLAVRRQCDLSELRAGLDLVPQVQRNVKVPDPSSAVGRESVQKVLRAAQTALGASGRLLVRPSGTEPVVRILVEGPEPTELQRWCEEIAAAVSSASEPTQ
ncbi:MAG: phosphoglucosamine mutase [Candidatus Binatia bacterium]|nr:MAG: phosphoglucosamine mutase [Candidatus Binatia bacterium]